MANQTFLSTHIPLTCSSAATMYMARMGSTAPFMVIDTDILFNGIPLNKIWYPGWFTDTIENFTFQTRLTFMSSTESMATPAIPTSPMKKCQPNTALFTRPRVPTNYSRMIRVIAGNTH
jgi:hypothetical protein